MAELKPCPFCGREVKLFVAGDGFGKRTILRCVNPRCYMSQYSPFTSFHNGDTEEHAEMRLTAAWNRRADGERKESKQPTDLTGKCGSCVFSAPTTAFGGSPCYVECTNADHLQQYCSRHDISKVRQRTTKACRRYKPAE